MITKNLFLALTILSVFLVNIENQVGIIKGNDFRSKAMIKFTDAYVNNDLNSVSDLFTEDAKIMVNDADLTYSSNGFRFFKWS